MVGRRQAGTRPGGSVRRPSLLSLGLFALTYFAFCWLADQLGSADVAGITIWPPGGLLLGLLLIADRRSWPWWIGTGLMAELAAGAVFFHLSPVPGLMIFTGNALEAVAGATFLRWGKIASFRFSDLRDILAFTLAGLLAPVVGATVGAATVSLTARQSFPDAWPLWWVGDASGVLVFTPAVLTVLQNWRKWRRVETARWIEVACLVALSVVTAHLVFTGRYPFDFLLLLPVLWAALRFETLGAALTSLLIALTASHYTLAGEGTVTRLGVSTGMQQFMVQLFLVVASLLALVLGTLARQRRQSMQALKVANRNLQSRVQAQTASLQASDKRFRHAADATNALIYETRPDDGTAVFAYGLERFVGENEVDLGNSDWWRGRIHPDDAPAHVTYHDACLSDSACQRYSSNYRIRHGDGSWRDVEDHGQIIRDTNGKAVQLIGSIVDVTERRHAEARERFLTREVSHRAKNTLSLVQAVARQLGATGGADFLGRFEERLQALAEHQNLLTQNVWDGVALDDLVRTQLAHFKDLFDDRIRIGGPALTLSGNAAQLVGMALHELATNAAKYGALSSDTGRIGITWQISAADDRFLMRWIESGGPRVKAPKHRGFGSTVIERMIRTSFGAQVILDFQATGLIWQFTCPSATLREMAATSAAAPVLPRP
ncbi:MASE1 domain-containing protein [Dongia rigui]|uniref:histidine kinase n=1 Tax=Dongia rigui TaxID=940149 RepID=A0ABU5E0Z0_9PROT|nr:MASE1 domain-containing protein [Dongia rigui]MDY0873174.1 MASE1 domain-containing protein [Dongia rigui]